MRIMRIALVLMLSCPLGCGRKCHETGDLLDVGTVTIYEDYELFSRAVEVGRSGSGVYLRLGREDADRRFILNNSGRIRIMGEASGGHRVVVERGTDVGDLDLIGNTGWIVERDLDYARPATP